MYFDVFVTLFGDSEAVNKDNISQKVTQIASFPSFLSLNIRHFMNKFAKIVNNFVGLIHIG